MIELRPLDWDSNFFNKKISKVELTDGNFNRQGLVQAISDSKDQLIYLFSSQEEAWLTQLSADNNWLAKHVDTKLTFTKKLKRRPLLKRDDLFFEEVEEANESLFDLALRSGSYSRFKLDLRLSNCFEDLYRLWLENSISTGFASHVRAVKVENSLGGFITWKENMSEASIGLIAVDQRHARKGVGSSLIQHCEEELMSKGIFTLSVPTQEQNFEAVKFYERNGFTLSNKLYIYHIWKSQG